MVSCLPASTAVIEPDPATVDIIVTSMGTGESRPLNVSAAGEFCAAAGDPIHVVPNERIAAHSKVAVNPPRIPVFFFKTQARFLEITNFKLQFAQIIRGLTY